MQSICIHATPSFRVYSFGNGWGLEIVKKGAHDGSTPPQSLWFQDDDASEIRKELDGLTQANGLALSYEDALRCIWGDYKSNAKELTQ